MNLRVTVTIAFTLGSLTLYGQQTPPSARPYHILLPQEHPAGPSQPVGISPSTMYQIYNVIFSNLYTTGQGQTIAIVDAFDDPTIEVDLGVFNTQFNVAPCTTASGCFSKIYSGGKQPAQNGSWSTEIALDVEWAHAMAPGAAILLVEAPSASSSDLMAAVQVAIARGASEVSMSWGVPEYAGELLADGVFQAGFQNRGVSFIASAGDSGHGVEYPSASPFVVGVGGTTVTYDQNGNWTSEAVWNNRLGATGGGLSRFESEPEWQGPFQISGKRGVPDVAYDADPNTGVAVYSSQLDSGQRGWLRLGGTSVGAPQIAAIVALVNNVRYECNGSSGLTLPEAFYTDPGMYHDITVGTNGNCGILCNASIGYDLTTGFGSPNGFNMADNLAYECYE